MYYNTARTCFYAAYVFFKFVCLDKTGSVKRQQKSMTKIILFDVLVKSA